MKKRLLTFMLAIATIISLTGCGSSSELAAYDNGGYSAGYGNSKSQSVMAASYDEAYDSSMVAYEEDMADSYNEAPASAVENSENVNTTNRKLIKSVTMSVETKDFDALVNNLHNSIETLGGYIEYMDTYNGSAYSSKQRARSASITARIPADKLSGFVNTVGEEANITNKTESVEDVTLNYVDMESHKNMLIAERDRLTELLESAETIEDMITIEDRLTQIRYEIDSMESQLRTYDNQVDYSTVFIGINEVIEYTPAPDDEYTTWERISIGFSNSLKDVGNGLKNFFVDLIIDLPYLIVFAVVVIIIVAIIKLILKRNPKFKEKAIARKAAKKAAKEQKKAAKAQKKAAKSATSEAENNTTESDS